MLRKATCISRCEARSSQAESPGAAAAARPPRLSPAVPAAALPEARALAPPPPPAPAPRDEEALSAPPPPQGDGEDPAVPAAAAGSAEGCGNQNECYGEGCSYCSRCSASEGLRNSSKYQFEFCRTSFKHVNFGITHQHP